MMIDVHVHVGRHTDLDTEIAGLSNYLAATDVESVFISNIQAARLGNFGRDLDETEANLATLRVAEANPRALALYWARPGSPDSHPQAVLGALSQSPFYGLVLGPKHADYSADDPRVDAYVQIASRFRLPVLVLSSRDEQSRPRRIYSLARRFPKQVFVILNSDADAHWREAVDCVQKSVSGNDSQLYLETAHIPAEEIVAALRVIKPDRILYGSDLDLGAVNGGVAEDVHRVRQSLDADHQQVMYGNASKLFDLDALRVR